jgi:transmembrane sensor
MNPHRGVLKLMDPTMQASERRDQAIAWRIRLSGSTASAAEWAAFQEWLEADPANAQAYDEVALADAELSDVIASAKTPQSAGRPPPAPWLRRRAVWAVAAGIVLAVVALPRLVPQRQLLLIQTPPGKHLEVPLTDGSLLTLNGGTRLTLDRRGERYARLEAGEVLFRVQHDPARPFVVEVGGSTLQDVGTQFNVREANGSLSVAVTEGAVIYNPKHEALVIMAGEQLVLATPQARAVVLPADNSTVAGWRQGHLSYQNSLLTDIVVDLSRSLGEEVSVAPELGTRRFTGSLQIEADHVVFFRRLEALLSVRAQQNAAGWTLTP